MIHYEKKLICLRFHEGISTTSSNAKSSPKAASQLKSKQAKSTFGNQTSMTTVMGKSTTCRSAASITPNGSSGFKVAKGGKLSAAITASKSPAGKNAISLKKPASKLITPKVAKPKSKAK